MFRARDLIDRPVVTLDTATAMADVKDVIIDTASNTLQGDMLKGRGFLASPNAGILPLVVSGIRRELAGETGLW